MFDLAAVQAAIQQMGFDGWLCYDFRGLNLLAKRIVQIPDTKNLSRRWFYFIPAKGEPKKLVHRIEPAALNHLPGTAQPYSRWQELEAGVQAMLGNAKTIAMEYSPRNGNPYISRVDAGTIELIKSFGVEIQSSGNLIQLFEACWDEEQWKLHLQAAVHTDLAYGVAFNYIAEQIRQKGSVSELAVQQRILDYFSQNGLTTYDPPNVSVGPNSGDPHYAPTPDKHGIIQNGDFVLIDLWAKMNQPRAVYSDLTRVAYLGKEVPSKYVDIFNIVAAARDAGIACVKNAFAQKCPLQGWEVDDATRAVIEKAGYGPYYTHRTGHSIGQETHGNGAHIDNFETHEDRLILPRTCFSIEPGIYLPEFGIRSEVNVYIDKDSQVHVTGGELQTEIVRIMV